MSRAGDDTTLARVARLVSDAHTGRSPVYVSHCLSLFLLAFCWRLGLTFYFTRDWMRTVAVLIVACPCALILATPTAMVAAIGGLARRGILVRGGSVLQLAANVGVVVFDKTGTITEGQFEIIRILTDGRPEHRLVAEVAAIDSVLPRPLAQVVAAEGETTITLFLLIEGGLVWTGPRRRGRDRGRRVRVRQRPFHCRGRRPAETCEWTDQCDAAGATSIWVAEDDAVAGVILLRDRVRPGVRECVAGLGDIGIDRLIMLTGDRPRAAEAIARRAGIREVEAGLLPEQKLERIRQLMGQGADVCMVGDGINDAPALATATVGVAVAGRATSPPKPPMWSFSRIRSRRCPRCSRRAVVRWPPHGRTLFSSRAS